MTILVVESEVDFRFVLIIVVDDRVVRGRDAVGFVVFKAGDVVFTSVARGEVNDFLIVPVRKLVAV